MTDLELTRACAKAAGLEFVAPPRGDEYVRDETMQSIIWVRHRFGMAAYDPLDNDEQAMALVKKFGLHIESDGPDWEVYHPASETHFSKDLNRAICECVANLPTATSPR